MLARLDETLAPGKAAVDREGNLLMVEGGPSAPDTVTTTVGEMGYIARPLESEPPNVARWYTRDQVEELSEEEAKVLASRFAAEIEKEGLLAKVAGGSAEAFIEATLLTGFRNAAKTGQIDPRAFRPPEEEFAGLTSTDRAAVVDWLTRNAGAGGVKG